MALTNTIIFLMFSINFCQENKQVVEFYANSKTERLKSNGRLYKIYIVVDSFVSMSYEVGQM